MADVKQVLKCPFCGHDKLEAIEVGVGQSVRWWKPGELLRRAIMPLVRKISHYRCLKCGYVIMFARD